MLLLLSLLATAAAAPALYDQRQDGEFNVRADVQNVVFLVALPQKTSLPSNIFDNFFKDAKPIDGEPELQERADVRVMQAFVEPNTPYHVEIGSERQAEGEGRAVEVVIAGRRRDSEPEPQPDEYKLLGATEQCGPDQVRDPETLACVHKSLDSVQMPASDALDKAEQKPAQKQKQVPLVDPVPS